jgi:hypothetical protein
MLQLFAVLFSLSHVQGTCSSPESCVAKPEYSQCLDVKSDLLELKRLGSLDGFGSALREISMLAWNESLPIDQAVNMLGAYVTSDFKLEVGVGGGNYSGTWPI